MIYILHLSDMYLNRYFDLINVSDESIWINEAFIETQANLAVLLYSRPSSAYT